MSAFPSLTIILTTYNLKEERFSLLIVSDQDWLMPRQPLPSRKTWRSRAAYIMVAGSLRNEGPVLDPKVCTMHLDTPRTKSH